MRKVGVSEDFERELGVFESHLDRSRMEFESVWDSSGLEAALCSQAAQSVSQYGEVVRLLSSPDLPGLVRDAVEALRDPNTPRWKALALATVLEALVDSGRVS